MAGRRQFRGSTVVVAVYDLSPANDCLYTIGLGVHHSGVRVNGREWTFSNDGIFSTSFGDVPDDVQSRAEVNLGELKVDSKVVDDAISDLRAAFPAGSYHLVKQNCNHFAYAFCQRLGYGVPGWVNRLAWLGSWWPLWPEMGGSGAATQPAQAARAPAYTAFGGGGQSLGGGAAAGGEAGGGGDARELRLRATQARLARMEAAAAAAKDE